MSKVKNSNSCILTTAGFHVYLTMNMTNKKTFNLVVQKDNSQSGSQVFPLWSTRWYVQPYNNESQSMISYIPFLYISTFVWSHFFDTFPVC